MNTTVELKENGFDATIEITPKKSIRIHGIRWGKEFDITFNIGDVAEYDSYNLSYMGEIVSITDKCVTINPHYSDRKRRLKLGTFAWRNYNFDLQKKTDENAETSQYI